MRQRPQPAAVSAPHSHSFQAPYGEVLDSSIVSTASEAGGRQWQPPAPPPQPSPDVGRAMAELLATKQRLMQALGR